MDRKISIKFAQTLARFWTSTGRKSELAQWVGSVLPVATIVSCAKEVVGGKTKEDKKQITTIDVKPGAPKDINADGKKAGGTFESAGPDAGNNSNSNPSTGSGGSSSGNTAGTGATGGTTTSSGTTGSSGTSTTGTSSNSGGTTTSTSASGGTTSSTSATGGTTLGTTGGSGGVCVNIVNVTAFPTDTTLVPTLKFYGRLGQTTIGLALPAYTAATTKLLVMVSILHANGSVVAQKRLGPTHFDVNGKLRPLAFNNLPLNQVEALHFLFEILDANNYRKTYRFSMAASFAFDLQFRSTTCLALTPPLPTTTGSSVPSTFAANQALPNFSEVKYAGFKSAVVDGTVYQFSGSRPLYIAQKAAQYTAASRLDGFVITDIVGNEIGSGATFTQILESPTIACFKQDSSGRWVRTIVRVG